MGLLLILIGLATSYFHWVGLVTAFVGAGILGTKFSRTLLLWAALFAAISVTFVSQLPPHVRASTLTVVSLALLLVLSILSTFLGYSLSAELRKS